MLFLRNCLVCNTEFAARTANHRLCSYPCRTKFYTHNTINIITLELDNAPISSDVQPIEVGVRGTDAIRGEANSL